MQTSLVSSNPNLQNKNTKDVLKGRARRLRNRAAQDLLVANGKRGARRPNGLTVADRMLRYADELASIELAIALLSTVHTA